MCGLFRKYRTLRSCRKAACTVLGAARILANYFNSITIMHSLDRLRVRLRQYWIFT